MTWKVLDTKMSKFRLADRVLDLGLVKLVNLGMDPDKSNWNLSIREPVKKKIPHWV